MGTAPEFYWIYFMFLSTLVPTLLHLLIAGASVMQSLAHWSPLKQWREQAAEEMADHSVTRFNAALYLRQHDLDPRRQRQQRRQQVPVLGFDYLCPSRLPPGAKPRPLRYTVRGTTKKADRAIATPGRPGRRRLVQGHKPGPIKNLHYSAFAGQCSPVPSFPLPIFPATRRCVRAAA